MLYSGAAAPAQGNNAPMSFSPDKLWHDLRRRNVFKAAAIYAASAWIVVQVADVVFDRLPVFSDPDRAMTFLIAAVIIGFPVTAVLAWLFEIGPDGLTRTRPGSATGVTAILVSLGFLAAGTAGLFVLLNRNSPTTRTPPSEIVANSVAVLPFANLLTDGGPLDYGAGIADVIRSKLVQVKKLHVVAKRSSDAVATEALDVAEIRRKLHVSQVLDGSIQRLGERVRVTAQLVDTGSARTVWSQVFDRDSGAIFAIQDEIVLAVADAMKAEIEPAVQTHIERPVTDNLDAYDLYLLARQIGSTTEWDSGFAEAIGYYEQALELDPQLAPAWAGLASTVYWHGVNGFIDLDEAIERAWKYSDRAIEIDPRLGEAYAIRITMHGRRGEAALADEAFARAIEYNPSSPDALLAYGIILRHRGRYPESIEVLQQGLELQPYRPDPVFRANIATSLFLLGEYERPMRMLGATYLDQLGEPTEGQYLRWMASSALETYRYDDAAALYAIARRDGHANAQAYANAALASLQLGRIGEAEKLIAIAEERMAAEQAEREGLDRDIAWVEFNRAMIYLAAGDMRNLLTYMADFKKKFDESPDEEYWQWRLYDLLFLNLALGRLEEAVETSVRLTESPTDAENYVMAASAHLQLAEVEATRGNANRAALLQASAATYLEQAQAEIDKQFQAAPSPAMVQIWVSAFHATAGRHNEALDFLERGYEANFRDVGYLHYMPMFDPLRNDPRYLDVIRNIKADLEAMSARVDETAASGDWESIVSRFLDAGSTARLAY